ncbi:MAG: hypothetical protein AB7F50_00365 [Fimbriimonadaceae bacterium]
MRKLFSLLGFVVLAAASMAQVGVYARGMNSTNLQGCELRAAKHGAAVRGEFHAAVTIDGHELRVRAIVVEMEVGPGDHAQATFVARGMIGDRPVLVRGQVQDNGDPENDTIQFALVGPNGPFYHTRTERQSVVIRRIRL